MDRQRIEDKYQEIKRDAEAGGYRLNPDKDFCLRLVEGLLVNQDRYGIDACPCRLYRGAREDNLDIACPCSYRDDDLAEYGACYCALYVNDGFDAERQVPDRRPRKEERAGRAKLIEERAGRTKLISDTGLAYPVWRCGVCGYLCANNSPPNICPICKVGKERFERFV